MWLFFGILAIISAIWNVVLTARRHEAKWLRFLSLSFTAFTLCAFYS